MRIALSMQFSIAPVKVPIAINLTPFLLKNNGLTKK